MATALAAVFVLLLRPAGAVVRGHASQLETDGTYLGLEPSPAAESTWDGSCKNRCGQYDLRRLQKKLKNKEATYKSICQCNPKCATKRDCCPDYFQECIRGHTEDGKVNDEITLDAGAMFWALAVLIFLAVAVLSLWINGAQVSFNLSCLPPGQMVYLPDDKDTTLDMRWSHIRFTDPDVEKYWLDWVAERKVVNGAKSLLCSTGMLILGQALQIQQQMQSSSNCLVFESKEITWAVNFGLLLILWVACFSCMWMPNVALYWGLVSFTYFYIPAVCLPPLGVSCREVSMCGEERTSRSIMDAYKHVDCSLQGITAMQLLMTWILFQPWVITKYDYMHSIFLWLVGVCLGWSVLFRGMFNETVFDNKEIGYAMGVLTVTLLISIRNAFRIEKAQRVRFVEDINQRHEGKKMFAILEYMMPTHVIGPMLANHMSEKREPIADEVETVSILFILLADFDTVTHHMTPSELLHFLNNAFTAFDKICHNRGVTKIETVGPEYVAAVGVLPKDVEENNVKGHKVLLERLVDAAHAILTLQTGDVQFKMGIHTGPIVAGVIGTKLPRYRLFGDTINSAARMMQKGVNASLQFGDETYKHLPSELKDMVEFRGQVEMKGKGKVNCYTSRPPGLVLEKKTFRTLHSLRELMKSSKSGRSVKGQRSSITGLTPLTEESAMSPSDSQTGMVGIKSIESLPDGLDDEEPEGEVSSRFEETLRAISKKDEAEGSFGILASRKGFTETMTKEWFHHYHERVIFRKSQRRFGLSAIALMIASGGELYYMFHSKIWIFPHSLYSKRWRWPVFVMSRFAAIFITLLWWYSVDSSTWLKTNARRVQLLLLFYVWATVFLVYISYDALTYSDHESYQTLMKESGSIFRAPTDIWFTCNFLLFYYLSMRMHALLFSTTLMFLPLTCGLVTMHRIVNVTTNHDKRASNWDSSLSVQAQFLIIAHTFMNIAVAHEDEQTSRARFKARHHIRDTNRSTNDLLDTLMPPLVVEELRSLPECSPPPSHQYRHATIAQSDLCGFTALASQCAPKEVVAFMEELFKAFDELTDVHRVYKVETVGDAYIAGMAEQPLTKWNSPASVVLFGLDMVRAVDRWAREMNVEVACRVGIHYGECIGGIVGNDMQRYHLFGEFLTCLEILESTSLEGRVQVSQACRNEVVRQLRDEPGAQKDEELEFKQRKDPDLQTSKGEVHHYSEVGGVTFLTNSLSKRLREVRRSPRSPRSPRTYAHVGS